MQEIKERIINEIENIKDKSFHVINKEEIVK